MSAREAALTAVRRGYDLHYADPEGPGNLGLLDGDRHYADGLAALASDGDLEGVAVLADLITDCARAHAEGRPADAESAWRKATARLS